MIQCEAIPYNNFQVNTYLLWNEEGDALVVDPAFYDSEEATHLEYQLKEKGLTLTGQLNTHCHVDHLLGVDYIRKNYQFPFRAHRDEEELVEKAPVLAELFGWKLDELGGIDEYLEEGKEILLGSSSLHCLLVPGHSPGSMAFYAPREGFVITGDALFQGSIGRTDLPGGDYDTLMAAIHAQLLTLPPETRVFPGHGPATTIGKEKVANPFLRELP
jgi:glyoxylase-like metal-dependent hydrolase (beta-lactamase superfamily II)